MHRSSNFFWDKGANLGHFFFYWEEKVTDQKLYSLMLINF